MSEIISKLQIYDISKIISRANDLQDKKQENKKQENKKLLYRVPKLNEYYWFYYICKYGNEYNKILEFVSKDKFEQIEHVRKDTSGLKILKIKQQTFEEDIIYSKHIHISSLKVLAYYNKLSLLVLKRGVIIF